MVDQVFAAERRTILYIGLGDFVTPHRAMIFATLPVNSNSRREVRDGEEQTVKEKEP